ncbi:RNA polymerase sigma-70 factor, ECF subfamily [Rhizobiales bacterium GAS191]|nr:RNA polymerase sigma-70 factor, ECF subfamily [Rhizobiales bacterium GAS113]SED90265.1 RNA polymerase sigma-70 factor, ECF subfamily [Rhizobiales bacterium GAS191]
MNVPAREEEWAIWMRAAISGDTVAYRRFLDSVAASLRAMSRRRFARLGLALGDAEDVVQEVLLAIHLKRHTWDRSRPIGPWIAAIARNKSIDALRRRGHRTETPIETVIDSLAAEEASDGLGRHDLDRLLAKLRDQQRDIVRSVALDGASIRETAERLKMSEGAVRVALHRALKALACLYRGDAE